ncbi:MAG: hypothetical protein ACLP1Y_14980 [Candidatus Acidiferrales bacterium]
MNSRRNLQFILLCGVVLVLAGALLGQNTPERTLVVNGKMVGAVLLQINGRSYVDVETLARITNGAVTFEPTRVVLTIPGSESGATTSSAAPPQTTQELSRDFAKAAIAEVAEMREWRGAIATMIIYGLAVSGKWADGYHDQARAGLSQAASTVSTEGDRDALQLLRNETDQLASWAGGVSTDRQNLNTTRALDPNTLQNDPALARITSCSQFLSGMLVTGVFADDASCH